MLWWFDEEWFTSVNILLRFVSTTKLLTRYLVQLRKRKAWEPQGEGVQHWSPSCPCGGHGCKPLSRAKNICVCSRCVLSGAVSAAKGFGGVSHGFRCTLSFVGCKTGHGIAYGLRSLHCLSLSSALPLLSHVNLLSESNFSSIWKCRRWWYLPKWQQYQLKSVRLGTQTAVIKW